MATNVSVADQVEAREPKSKKGKSFWQKASNYVVQHWRGEHSLVRSWWINSICVDIAIMIIFLLSLAICGYLFAALMGCINFSSDINKIAVAICIGVPLYVCWYCTMMVISVWQLVGCWRAAVRHKLETQKYFWATVVQVITVTSAICMAREVAIRLAVNISL